MVRIRLARGGGKRTPFYRVVVADSRAPRDGRFIEKIGYYNPLQKLGKELGKDSLAIKQDRFDYWLGKGARASARVLHLQKLASASPLPSSALPLGPTGERRPSKAGESAEPAPAKASETAAKTQAKPSGQTPG